jgi:hypothetical protein
MAGGKRKSESPSTALRVNKPWHSTWSKLQNQIYYKLRESQTKSEAGQLAGWKLLAR